MPKVALGSVVGTTFMYSIPSSLASSGIQSTGTRSIRFISRIQTKSVSARGATSAFFPEKDPRTLSSMKSMTHSTKFRKPLGVSAVARTAALRNNHRNRAPSNIDQNMVSRWIAQNPIALASAALWAKTQVPSVGSWPKVRFCRWCLIYSVVVGASLAISKCR